MVDLKTKEPLLKALSQAANHVFSAEELHEQRVSFIMGAVTEDSGVTREKVEEVLAKHEGR